MKKEKTERTRNEYIGRMVMRFPMLEIGVVQRFEKKLLDKSIEEVYNDIINIARKHFNGSIVPVMGSYEFTDYLVDLHRYFKNINGKFDDEYRHMFADKVAGVYEVFEE